MLAFSHWQERAEPLLETNGVDREGSIGDLFDYESPPLVPTGSVDVRFEFVGPLEPIPYEWDD